MIERRRGGKRGISAGNWKDRERKSVSRGRGRSTAIEEQVASKWVRELEGGWEGEREGEGVCIAFLLHQFRVTRFEDAGSDILIGFALTSTPLPSLYAHTHPSHSSSLHTHTHPHP